MSRSDSDKERSQSREKKRRPDSSNVPQDAKPQLYIGNIDRRVTQDQLKDLFASQGQLQYCYIVYEPKSNYDSSSRGGGESKVSRGYGFAKYKRLEDAISANEKLQGKDLNGRAIRVNFSKRGAPREPTPGRYLGRTRDQPDNRYRRRERSRSRGSSNGSSRSHRKKRDRSHQKKRKYRRSRSRDEGHKRRRSPSDSPRR